MGSNATATEVKGNVPITTYKSRIHKQTANTVQEVRHYFQKFVSVIKASRWLHYQNCFLCVLVCTLSLDKEAQLKLQDSVENSFLLNSIFNCVVETPVFNSGKKKYKKNLFRAVDIQKNNLKLSLSGNCSVDNFAINLNLQIW